MQMSVRVKHGLVIRLAMNDNESGDEGETR